MRVLRSILLLCVGVMGGFVAAALAMKRALPSRGDAASDDVALVAIFDSKQLRSESSAFRGGSMLAWFGGVEVDLREATLAPAARISVAALFGGVALRVPPGWRVRSKMTAIAGGVEVSGEDPEGPDAPLLELDGYAFCGGVAVGRKPLAEGA